jgi:hypothetical protein
MLFKMYLANKKCWLVRTNSFHQGWLYPHVKNFCNDLICHTLRSVIGHCFNNYFLCLLLCNKVINPLVTPRGKRPFWIEDYTILMYPIPMLNHTLWKTSTTTPLGPRTLPLAIAFKVTSNSTFMGWSYISCAHESCLLGSSKNHFKFQHNLCHKPL